MHAHLLCFIDLCHVLSCEVPESESSTPPSGRVSRAKNLTDEQLAKLEAMQKPGDMDPAETHPTISVLLHVALGI